MENEQKKEQEVSKSGCLVLLVLAVGIAFGFASCAGCFHEPTAEELMAASVKAEKEAEMRDKWAAFCIAKEFVSDRLKSPKSAEFKGIFDDWEDDVERMGKDVFCVKSWVDSKNSFGAMVRAHFMCSVHRVEGGTWHLLAIKIAE